MIGYIILALIISILINMITIWMYLELKKDKKLLVKEVIALKEIKSEVAEVENKKTKIRNEQNEKENDIINSNNFDNGVMPINATKKSGSYRDRSRKSNTSNS